MTIAREGVTRPGNRTRLTDCFNQFSENPDVQDWIRVTDLTLWHNATERLERLLAGLPVATARELSQLLVRYRTSKEIIAEVVEKAGAAAICRECAGQCCLNGKYRVNVVDALACLVAQRQPTVDFFHKPACPYGTDAGCSMKPGLRPADCVVFICDAIDQKLSAQARSILAAQEQVLRDCVLKVSGLLDDTMGTPLLLWADKNGSASK